MSLLSESSGCTQGESLWTRQTGETEQSAADGVGLCHIAMPRLVELMSMRGKLEFPNGNATPGGGSRHSPCKNQLPTWKRNDLAMMLISLWSLDISLDQALGTLLGATQVAKRYRNEGDREREREGARTRASKESPQNENLCLYSCLIMYMLTPLSFLLSFFLVSQLVCCDRRFVCRCCLVSLLVSPPASPLVCLCDWRFA